MKTTGKLYGIGVGPGDSKLLTVKAVEIIQKADIIITPKTEKKRWIRSIQYSETIHFRENRDFTPCFSDGNGHGHCEETMGGE